ncbi:MAG TPA: lysophospholipase [Alphaproteobacteria bacterium]|nr:lysophospholipase [Alphaproteobacteria bacterium]
MNQGANFQSFDGTRLFLKKDIPAAPKAILVIVHGLCEHLGRYDYITKKMTDRDFGVYRFDHRGHGRSEGKPIFYNDFNELIDDVNAVVELAKEENPTLPVFLIGHSMGGFAVTTFGMKYPNKVSGIVASGAVARLNQPFPIPPNLPVDTYFPNELGDGVCSDPAVVEAYKNDPLVGKQVSAGLFYSLFAGVDWNKENSGLFVEPVLLLHGCDDGLVSEKDSRDLFGDISSKDKTLKIYAFLYHEIFNEPSKDDVIQDVVKWLEQRI